MVTNQSKDSIYSKLYKLTDEKAKKNGVSLMSTESVFLYIADTGFGTLDGKKIEEADEKEYLDLVYTGILSRLPDADAKKNWHEFYLSAPYKYRTELVNALWQSDEARDKKIRFIRNSIVSRKRRLTCLDRYLIKCKGESGNSELDEENNEKGVSAEKSISIPRRIYRVVIPYRIRIWVRNKLNSSK